MKSKIWTIGLISIVGLIFISCTDAYVGEKTAKGWVINEWQSGTNKVIRIKLDGNYLTIDDTYFGDTNPKVGDCVKVWVSVWKEGLRQMPHGDRNISNCSPANK